MQRLKRVGDNDREVALPGFVVLLVCQARHGIQALPAPSRRQIATIHKLNLTQSSLGITCEEQSAKRWRSVP